MAFTGILRPQTVKQNPPHYDLAKKGWDDRYYDHLNAKRNWQIAAAVLAVICLTLTKGIVDLSAQQKVVPYVVEVDQAGFTQAIQAADKAPEQPDYVLRKAIADVIRKLRTVMIDPRAMKENFDEAYKGYIRGAAVQYLDEYYRKNDPFQAGREHTVNLEAPPTIIRETEKTWSVRWRETTRALSGTVEKTVAWEAHIVAEIQPPQTTLDISINPTGLRIVDMSWTETL